MRPGNPKDRDQKFPVLQKRQDQNSPGDPLDLKERRFPIPCVFLYTDILREEAVPGMNPNPANGDLPPDGLGQKSLHLRPNLDRQHDPVDILHYGGADSDHNEDQKNAGSYNFSHGGLIIRLFPSRNRPDRLACKVTDGA